MLAPITLETRAALREALSLTRDALSRVVESGETFNGQTRAAESVLKTAELELASAVFIADRRPLTPASQVQADGYRVHRDMHGWYVVAPDEEEPDDGSSPGFDGRDHYATEEAAWAAAVAQDGNQ